MVNLRVRSLWLRSLIVGLLTGVIGALLILTPPGVSFEEEVGLAWLFRVRGAVEPPREVAVVAISGTTGSRLGLPKLPRDWPRTVHAGLVEGLRAHDVAVSIFDMDFSRAKPGVEDEALALAIAEAGRMVLFERLVGRRQPIEGANGQPDGWTWVEEKQSPAPVLADAATALAPFALPKLGQAAIQFWTFKASLGELPMIPAVALQLYALPAWEEWHALLAAAGAQGLGALPVGGDVIREPAEVRRVMGLLRQMFLADPELEGRVRARLEAAGQGAASDPAAPAAARADGALRRAARPLPELLRAARHDPAPSTTPSWSSPARAMASSCRSGSRPTARPGSTSGIAWSSSAIPTSTSPTSPTASTACSPAATASTSRASRSWRRRSPTCSPTPRCGRPTRRSRPGCCWSSGC